MKKKDLKQSRKHWKLCAKQQQKDVTNLLHDNDRLRECLKEAWSAGSNHQMPSMAQLNTWYAAINEKHKIIAEDTPS